MYHNKSESTSAGVRDPEVRLLSINEARKKLGVRYEAVKNLLDTGKIKYVEINGRKKIAYKNLTAYIDNANANIVRCDNGIITEEETQRKIDSLFKSIRES